jgi:AraC-like DNA-binding protein
MHAPHAHADIEWNYLERGSFRYRWRGAEVELPPQRLVLFWAGLPHQALRCSDDCVFTVGVLPAARVLAWRLPRAALARLQAGEWLCGNEDRHGDDRRLLDRWRSDLAGRAPHRDQVELEAQARFRRLLIDAAPGAAAEPDAARLLAALVERHTDADLSTERLAGELGLNPKRACAQLRAHVGETPGRFLRAYRIGEAQRLLTAGRAAAATGRAVGFGSTAAFYAAFRAVVGASPAAWQRAQADGAAAASP